MMPFKTKLTPNWQMMKNHEWEKDYPKAEYPNREKEPVSVFDLKGFVEKRKEDKINSMLGGNTKESNSMPFVPPMFGDKNTNSSNGGFNVDDLVKKIDAKIAELEEEERLEKEAEKAKENSQVEKPAPVVEETPKPKILDEIKLPEVEEEPKIEKQPQVEIKPETQPEVSTSSTSRVIEENKQKIENNVQPESNKNITDDQFFDDFFNEDE